MTRGEWARTRAGVIEAQSGRCHGCAWGWPLVRVFDVVRVVDSTGKAVLRAYCRRCRRLRDGKARALKARRTKAFRADHPQLTLPRT